MTSRQQRDSAQLTLSREVGFVRKPHANRLRVALAFPNTYFVGMSNLGFQTVYRLFNAHPDVVCERVFLPPKQELAALLQSGARLVTVESQTPVKEFDVLAFGSSSGTTRPTTGFSGSPRSVRSGRTGRECCFVTGAPSSGEFVFS